MNEQQFTIVVSLVALGVALCIFLVVRSLGKPVELPQPKPPRRQVAARQPRARRAPRALRNQPPPGRQLAPDDDIEFLRSLNPRPPRSDS
ncbi:MAG: hypothetical protein ACRCYU_22930 [Nocardioides sp.]